MKLLYKPFGLIFKFIGRRLARSVFQQIWSAIDDQAPPKPTTRDASVGKIVGAQALEAGVSAGVGAAVDRAGVVTFHYLIGGWPGKETEAPKDD
ncbi:MAG TPA: DUF4235 domain-containing protein [Solirubrobacteraceae bacterium]